ncbi:Integrator complex subunit 6 [Blyttiomyces sp. JEL0837]|nr:Integrator complex subunit 6 [Blyttiomyces sp. JEL0837]
MSSGGQALYLAFDYINAYRFSIGLETVGAGRFPAMIDPTVIMWFTDAGALTTFENGKCTVTEKLTVPGLRTPGSSSYLEPFRWDQRLLTFALSPQNSPVNPEMILMSQNMNALHRSIENCMAVQKPPHPNVYPQIPVAITVRVAVTMEEISENEVVGRSQRIHLLPPTPKSPDDRSVARTFPIPEPMWVDHLSSQQRPRTAIPVITYSTVDASYSIPHNFPFDRFQMDQSNWADLLQRKSGTCWTLFVRNSGKEPNTLGSPFGFLKVSTQKQLHKNPSWKSMPPPTWKKQFYQYVSEIPVYYHAHVQNAMKKIGLGNVLQGAPFVDFGTLPICAQMNTVREQAKAEFGRFITAAAQSKRLEAEKQRLALLENKSAFSVVANTPEVLCVNAFDVPRDRVLMELNLLRTAFHQTTEKPFEKIGRIQEEQDLLHSVPIPEMGNYQTRKQQQPLRDPFETDEEMRIRANRDPFGNPWVRNSKPGQVASDRDEVSNEAMVMQNIDGAGNKLLNPQSPTFGGFSPSGIPRRKIRQRSNKFDETKRFDDQADTPGSDMESVTSDYSMASGFSAASFASAVSNASTTSTTRSIAERLPSLARGLTPVLLPPPATLTFDKFLQEGYDFTKTLASLRLKDDEPMVVIGQQPSVNSTIINQNGSRDNVEMAYQQQLPPQPQQPILPPRRASEEDAHGQEKPKSRDPRVRALELAAAKANSSQDSQTQGTSKRMDPRLVRMNSMEIHPSPASGSSAGSESTGTDSKTSRTPSSAAYLEPKLAKRKRSEETSSGMSGTQYGSSSTGNGSHHAELKLTDVNMMHEAKRARTSDSLQQHEQSQTRMPNDTRRRDSRDS